MSRPRSSTTVRLLARPFGAVLGIVLLLVWCAHPFTHLLHSSGCPEEAPHTLQTPATASVFGKIVRAPEEVSERACATAISCGAADAALALSRADAPAAPAHPAPVPAPHPVDSCPDCALFFSVAGWVPPQGFTPAPPAPARAQASRGDLASVAVQEAHGGLEPSRGPPAC